MYKSASQVLEPGSGPRPSMQERVKIVLQQEMPELGTSLPEQTLEYTLGDGDVVQGRWEPVCWNMPAC